MVCVGLLLVRSQKKIYYTTFVCHQICVLADLQLIRLWRPKVKKHVVFLRTERIEIERSSCCHLVPDNTGYR